MTSSLQTERYEEERRVDELMRYAKSILHPGPPPRGSQTSQFISEIFFFSVFILLPRQRVVRLTSSEPALCASPLMEDGTPFSLCSERYGSQRFINSSCWQFYTLWKKAWFRECSLSWRVPWQHVCLYGLECCDYELIKETSPITVRVPETLRVIVCIHFKYMISQKHLSSLFFMIFYFGLFLFMFGVTFFIFVTISLAHLRTLLFCVFIFWCPFVTAENTRWTMRHKQTVNFWLRHL